jgi:long-chain-acyl-CoA dehydrogenase
MMINFPSSRTDTMSIETFTPKWMTEEHEMVYDSALKMFQSW